MYCSQYIIHIFKKHTNKKTPHKQTNPNKICHMHFKEIIFCANYKIENIRMQLQKQKYHKVPDTTTKNDTSLLMPDIKSHLLFSPALHNHTKKSFY